MNNFKSLFIELFFLKMDEIKVVDYISTKIFTN